MATKTDTTLPLGREVGAGARIAANKKTNLRIGWEAAAEVLDVLREYDEREIASTAAVLKARFK